MLRVSLILIFHNSGWETHITTPSPELLLSRTGCSSIFRSCTHQYAIQFHRAMTPFQTRSLPPPPPTPLKPQMKVDFVRMWIPHMGNARNLRYSRPPPPRGARRGRAGISFSTWACACASQTQAPSSFAHAGGRRRFRLGVSSSVGHCCQHFWVGWGPNQIKGGLRRGKRQRDKQALQMFLGRLQLDDADVVVYKGSKTPRPCCRSCGKSLFWMCMALVTSINMAGCACKCGVGSLVHLHHRKFDRSHSDAAVLCAAALVFPSLGQDLRNNQTNAGYPEGFGMVERSQPFVLLSWTYLRLWTVRASRVCPSKPPRQEPINYM